MALFSSAVRQGVFSARPTDNTALTEGRLFYATDTNALYRDNGTGWDAWVLSGGGGGGAGTVFVLTDQPDVNNTTSETTLLGAGIGSLTLPIGWFSNGRGLRVRLWCAINSKVSSPGTALIRMTLDSNEVWTLGSLTLPSGYSGVGIIDIDLFCYDDSVPSSVQVRGNGTAHFSDTNFPPVFLEWFNPGTNYSVDGTVTNDIDVTVTFSVANAANELGCYGAIINEIPAP